MTRDFGLWTASCLVLAACICWNACAAVRYSNPVVPGYDSPDPGAAYDPVTKAYYVATTSQDAADAFPIRSSTDLVNWTLVGHVFSASTRPKWAMTDFWAPELHFVNGRWMAYFAARDSTGMLCVGAAYSTVSGNILGPYQDSGSCLMRNSSVGMIDPHFFQDPSDGQGYLVWKEDGNGRQPPEPHTPIWVQALSNDGLSFIGTRFMAIWNDQPWEGNLVEAPWILPNRQTGYLYLFYSANAFYDERYSVGVARARSIRGPWQKFGPPILHSNNIFEGPGHCSVVVDRGSGEVVMVYHSWESPNVGGPGDDRMLMVDRVQWFNGWPAIATNGTPSVGPHNL